MAHRVYIDGHAGTTGLRIREWLAGREDLSLAQGGHSNAAHGAPYLKLAAGDLGAEMAGYHRPGFHR